MFKGEVPDRGAALAAMALWAAVSCGLVALTMRTRTWFMMAAAAAGFMQLAAYALRATLLDQPRPQPNSFITMVALFLISPPLLAATNYLCLGKLISASPAAAPTKLPKMRCSDHDSVTTAAAAAAAVTQGSGFAGLLSSLMGVSVVGQFQQRRRVTLASAVTAAFCIGELAALALQCAGAGLVASGNGDSLRETAAARKVHESGRWLLLAGVCLQLAVFTVFTVLALTVKFGVKFGYAGTGKFTAAFACLFGTIACQYVRQIFRVVVYAQGLKGFLATHERFGVYGFDFAPLLACGLLVCCLHYGWWLGPVAARRATLQQQSVSTSSSRAALVQDASESADI
ncbi:hypothetical protein OEZ85_009997 [Tetradesmus obliquus]|uniref:Uncharacterized protein n=1 Tax=Tetradesmus obliquus TaxID=3088 RepID=A0ABY8UB02_TETOB|nr:hypothetical protein OEZ85_009997 [Tetradesmus obliquus]